MSRIFVLGYELPSLTEGATIARNYRTFQFVEPLLQDEHQVSLLVGSDRDQEEVPHDLGKGLVYHRVKFRRRGWLPKVKQLYEAFAPDGVLAVTFYNCVRAVRCGFEKPIWMDIYGDRMAESQVWQTGFGSSRGMLGSLTNLRDILARGDGFSTCGTPQKFAMVGQLSMIGRLNRHNCGYEFVYPILPGAPRQATARSAESRVRGKLVEEDDFVVLWCGGYNIWTDVETLFRALEHAMSRVPNLKFVSVGGRVGPTHWNDVYERFQEMIAASEHRERFILLGWQPTADVPDYYREADVGISLDAFHYETLLGTRTRLTEMMRYGLPAITTLGCELSYIIRDQELGLTFEIGDAEKFGDQIVILAQDRERLVQMSERALRHASTTLSFFETTQPFRQWAAEPCFAPDYGSSEPIAEDVLNVLRFWATRMMWKLLGLGKAD